MTTRSNSAPRSKIKATIIDNDTQRVDGEATMGSFFASLGLPTYKRAIVAFITSVLITGASVYIGTQLTVYLAFGAAVLTGSAFIMFMTMFLGYAITVLASLILGGKVQTFILDGSIDRVAMSAVSAVSGWLKDAKRLVTSTTSKVTS